MQIVFLKSLHEMSSLSDLICIEQIQQLTNWSYFSCVFFPPEKGDILHEMSAQVLGKNKKNFKMPSAEILPIVHIFKEGHI